MNSLLLNSDWFNPDARQYGSLLALTRAPEELCSVPRPGPKQMVAGDHVIYVWDAEFAELPSLFRKLVYLSCLKDPQTGRYRHFGIAMFAGEERTDEHLRMRHDQCFNEWLRLSLREQKEDIERFIADLPITRREVLLRWTELPIHLELIPDAAAPEGRDLYRTDAELVLAVLRTQFGLADRIEASAAVRLKPCVVPA